MKTFYRVYPNKKNSNFMNCSLSRGIVSVCIGHVREAELPDFRSSHLPSIMRRNQTGI
jgi:hypothetical protein